MCSFLAGYDSGSFFEDMDMVDLFSCVIGMLLGGRAEYVWWVGEGSWERGTRNEECVSMTCLTRKSLLFLLFPFPG
jgi:hypothetical protein